MGIRLSSRFTGNWMNECFQDYWCGGQTSDLYCNAYTLTVTFFSSGSDIQAIYIEHHSELLAFPRDVAIYLAD